MSGPLALWHPLYHVSGMRRPRGGSGMLTQALVHMIEAHGGTVHTSQPVTRILVEGGRAVGVETGGGERLLARRGVISGAHLHTTLRLLDGGAPPAFQQRVAKTRIGNGFGMITRFAVHELPRYAAAPTAPGEIGEHHRAMQFICPDLDYLDRAYADFAAGRPSREPGLIVMTWSAVDDTLAPAGKHVMFVWAQYYPYELASGECWDDIADREADRMLEVLRPYAPNITRENEIGRLVETPLFLERELGLLRGNVMHLEMSVDQMFFMRPYLGGSGYKTPVRNLYLTGASSHPGGGIMGAAGRNAAHAILRGTEASRAAR
jgi:phytoene dehydrogenase-like protein